MKTAEDILNEVVGWSNEITEEMCYEAMKQYAKQACKEQRKICAKANEFRNTLKIENANEPQLK